MEELKTASGLGAVQPSAAASELDTRTTLEAPASLERAATAIDDFLRALGHAPERDAQLRETGRLVAAAFHDELLAGYRMDPAQILGDAVATSNAELVLVRDIDVTCMCPHHLLPASGVMHIGYVPQGKIVGLGAIARLAHCFSRRLILQEELCERVVDALSAELAAKGAVCVADLSPACLCARGERPARARVISAASRGVLRDDHHLRAQLMTPSAAGPLAAHVMTAQPTALMAAGETLR